MVPFRVSDFEFCRASWAPDAILPAMPASVLNAWSDISTPVVGMVHLRPLPGAPRYDGDLSAVRDAMRRDAHALAEAGVDGLMLENFGDAPFLPGRVPAHVVAHMTTLARSLRRDIDLPLGINVLRNDGRSALAVAHAAGAQFIRVNVLCGARLTDQGLIQGIAHDLLRDRTALGATDVKIFADVNVKHSSPVAPRPVEDEARDTFERGGADILIVSGPATGSAAAVDEINVMKAAVPDAPVFVGSGITADNIDNYRSCADGFIVGTSLKHDSDVVHPVDPQRVKSLLRKLR